jgi:general stress protein YciG
MTQGRQRRGFASMDAQRQRDIARLGGRSVPGEKRSFAQNHGLAAAAGRTGGQNVPDTKRSFAQNRALAAEAGRKGGISRRRRTGPDNDNEVVLDGAPRARPVTGADGGADS